MSNTRAGPTAYQQNHPGTNVYRKNIIYGVWWRGLETIIMYVDDGDDMKPHAHSKATDPPTTHRMIDEKPTKQYHRIVEYHMAL